MNPKVVFRWPKGERVTSTSGWLWARPYDRKIVPSLALAVGLGHQTHTFLCTCTFDPGWLLSC